MSLSPLRVLKRLWLAALVVVYLLWLTQALELMRTPVRIGGPWSVRVGQTWPWKISVQIYRDLAQPRTAPPFGPRWQYTPQLWSWYYANVTPEIYNRWLGFDYNTSPNLEISATHSWLLRGDITTVRTPEAYALLLLIPLAFPLIRLFRRRHRKLQGLCLHCGYDLRATAGCCPECGAMAKGKGSADVTMPASKAA